MSEVGGVGGDDLGERIVRVVDILVAGAQQHAASVGVDIDGQLCHQPALADAGLTGHEHEAASCPAHARCH